MSELEPLWLPAVTAQLEPASQAERAPGKLTARRPLGDTRGVATDVMLQGWPWHGTQPSGVSRSRTTSVNDRQEHDQYQHGPNSMTGTSRLRLVLAMLPASVAPSIDGTCLQAIRPRIAGRLLDPGRGMSRMPLGAEHYLWLVRHCNRASYIRLSPGPGFPPRF